MGFFGEIFKDKKPGMAGELPALHAVYTMLAEDKYWNIINESQKVDGAQDRQLQFLKQKISQLNPIEIIGFKLRTDYLLYQSYTSEMWCAAHIMNGGCSDDGFEYFRNWIISQGKSAYYIALNNPDDLIQFYDPSLEFYRFEELMYVALDVFLAKTNKNMYDYIDDAHFKTNEAHYPNLNFNWSEENKVQIKTLCPKLYDRFIGDF